MNYVFLNYVLELFISLTVLKKVKVNMFIVVA